MFSLYLGFAVFALFASITPGPSNLVALMIGTRYGVPAAVPFVVGASLSMAAILWVAGMGLADVMTGYPRLKQILGISGAVWISWMAWQLAMSATAVQSDGSRARPAGWVQGMGLQLVNPKAWMMALSTASLFAWPGADSLAHVSRLALIFFLVALSCQLLWSWLGQSVQALEGFRRRQIWINRLLATVLVLLVWSAALSA